MRVVLSGFGLRLFCIVHAKTLYRYDCMYFLAACVCRCDGDVICVGHGLSRFLGGGLSAVYMLNSVGERTPVLNRRCEDV